jgi:hypothetical protein
MLSLPPSDRPKSAQSESIAIAIITILIDATLSFLIVKMGGTASKACLKAIERETNPCQIVSSVINGSASDGMMMPSPCLPNLSFSFFICRYGCYRCH